MSTTFLLLAIVATICGVAVLPTLIRQCGLRTLLLATCLAAYLLPQTQLSLPIDPRIVGLACILALFVYTPKPHVGFHRSIPGPIIVAITYIALSALWTTGTASNTAAQAGFLAGMCLLLSVPFTQAELRNAILVVAALLVAAIAYVFATAPSEVFLADRLRGPMINPNGLAVLCVIIYPALCKFPLKVVIPASIGTLAVTWETGSRAAVLAVTVQVFFALVGRLRPIGRVMATGLVAAAASYLVPVILRTAATEGAGSDSVLRSNNSRDIVWGASIERVREHPWVGSGLGSLTSDFETGSSVFSILIVGGIVGLAVVAYPFAKSLWYGFLKLGPGDWRSVALTGTLISAGFEGWLIAAGTMYALIAWLIASHTLRRNVVAGATRSSEPHLETRA